MARSTKDVAALLAAKLDSESAIKEANRIFSSTSKMLDEAGITGEKLETAILDLKSQRDGVVEFHRELLAKIRRQVAGKVAKLESATFDAFLANEFVRQTLNTVR